MKECLGTFKMRGILIKAISEYSLSEKKEETINTFNYDDFTYEEKDGHIEIIVLVCPVTSIIYCLHFDRYVNQFNFFAIYEAGKTDRKFFVID